MDLREFAEGHLQLSLKVVSPASLPEQVNRHEFYNRLFKRGRDQGKECDA